jgi:endonuclease/exonuclease/phosphatase family metal-dependent hydrolase
MVSSHRVMSLNINGVSGDAQNTWERRSPVVAALIRRYSPDIIGMQEVCAENQGTFREALSDYEFVPGNCYGDTPPQEYTPVFWKSARYSLLDTGEFWFSRTPDVESADWGVEYPMGATWVKLQCRETGQALVVLNAHFEDGPDGELSRVEASKLIVERTALRGSNLPVLLTGDFNCNPWSAPYRIFRDAGFVDTYRAAGHADSVHSSTFHAYKGDAYFALEYGSEMFWRVDWIMARGRGDSVQTTASMIVREASPPTYPSDHYPMVSEVQLRAV